MDKKTEDTKDTKAENVNAENINAESINAENTQDSPASTTSESATLPLPLAVSWTTGLGNARSGWTHELLWVKATFQNQDGRTFVRGFDILANANVTLPWMCEVMPIAMRIYSVAVDENMGYSTSTDSGRIIGAMPRCNRSTLLSMACDAMDAPDTGHKLCRCCAHIDHILEKEYDGHYRLTTSPTINGPFMDHDTTPLALVDELVVLANSDKYYWINQDSWAQCMGYVYDVCDAECSVHILTLGGCHFKLLYTIARDHVDTLAVDTVIFFSAVWHAMHLEHTRSIVDRDSDDSNSEMFYEEDDSAADGVLTDFHFIKDAAHFRKALLRSDPQARPRKDCKKCAALGLKANA